MPKISEHALAVAISALAARIRDLKLRLLADEQAGDDLSEEWVDAHVDLQDTVAQYVRILTQMRDEYEVVLKEGHVGGLPSYEDITKPFRLEAAPTSIRFEP